MRIASLIAAGILCVLPSPAQDRLREQVDGIYRAGRYERALPERPERRRVEPPRPEPGDEERTAARRDIGRRSRDSSHPVPDAQPDDGGRFLSDALLVLPWVACAVIAAAVIANVIRARRRSGRAVDPAARPEGAPAERAPEPQAAAPSAALALAHEGRYAEAIHALLLAAIDAIRPARPLAASLTSREVLAAVTLDPGRREALLHLVQAVELTRFGGRPADAADFDSCSAELGRIAP